MPLRDIFPTSSLFEPSRRTDAARYFYRGPYGRNVSMSGRLLGPDKWDGQPPLRGASSMSRPLLESRGFCIFFFDLNGRSDVPARSISRIIPIRSLRSPSIERRLPSRASLCWS